VKVIVGLGNPGREYDRTRHNIGFFVLDVLAERNGLTWKRSRLYQGLLAQGRIDGQPCCLLKPLTYMNLSGQSVRPFVKQRKVDLADMLIVCDDFDLRFGQLRIRPGGSHGGHNGLESVIQHLRSNEFARLRIGIGAPPPRCDAADFVLSPFRPGEKKEIGNICDVAADCCLTWLSEGVSATMNQFNTRKKEKGHE